MHENKKSLSHLHAETFGNLLRYLRKRAQLTQRELAIAVGYSEAHISRLERSERLPDLSTLAALFVPALGLRDEPETIAHFLELAAVARGEAGSIRGELTLVQSTENEVTQTLEPTSVPSNLPLQLTSFVGREAEIEEIKRLLLGEEKVRLLTLFGAGGSGKTRLVLQVAEQLVLDFPHGIWFVDLSPLMDVRLISRAVASSLGLTEVPGQDSATQLAAFLRPRKLAIVLDNCEHLVLGAAQIAEAILSACPQIQILATSRELLRIPGEKPLQIQPLPCPPVMTIGRNQVRSYDSVRLFVQRAQSLQPGFEITDDNAAPIAEICRRLDGIPLAIELAAARVRLLRVQQIEAQLGDRFRLLTGGRRTLPRHQTLQGMIDWSHDLLPEEERRLFRRLAVFSGGWEVESAEGISGGDAQTSTLDLLAHLVDKSFILTERQLGREARYTMLETLREYALKELESSGETRLAHQLHFDYFHTLALQSRLYGPEKQSWLDRLESDHDNLRSALTWAIAYRDSRGARPYLELAAELVAALVDFFWFRGFIAEARGWLDQLLVVDLPDSPLRALLLQKAGWYARVSGEFAQADKFLQHALEVAGAVGDTNRLAWTLMDLGLSTRDQGNLERAVSYFNEALFHARASGEQRAIGNCLYFLAESHSNDLDRAKSLWEQGLEVLKEDGDRMQIGWGVEGLAGVAFLQQDFARARALHMESLKAKLEVMDKPGLIHSLEGIAQISAAEEEPERAAVLWGAAHQLRALMVLPPDPSRRGLYTSLIPDTRAQIGEERFDRLWKQGAAMQLEEVIEFALSDAGSPSK